MANFTEQYNNQSKLEGWSLSAEGDEGDGRVLYMREFLNLNAEEIAAGNVFRIPEYVTPGVFSNPKTSSTAVLGLMNVSGGNINIGLEGGKQYTYFNFIPVADVRETESHLMVPTGVFEAANLLLDFVSDNPMFSLFKGINQDIVVEIDERDSAFFDQLGFKDAQTSKTMPKGRRMMVVDKDTLRSVDRTKFSRYQLAARYSAQIKSAGLYPDDLKLDLDGLHSASEDKSFTFEQARAEAQAVILRTLEAGNEKFDISDVFVPEWLISSLVSYVIGMGILTDGFRYSASIEVPFKKGADYATQEGIPIFIQGNVAGREWNYSGDMVSVLRLAIVPKGFNISPILRLHKLDEPSEGKRYGLDEI